MKLADDFRLLEEAQLLEPIQRLGNPTDRLGAAAENLGNYSAVLSQQLSEAQKALIDAKELLVLSSLKRDTHISRQHQLASKIHSDILELLR
ncbi:MAG: hypothetical protein KC777_18620 [Cyanobacteria bacterium HKST-UBA02]|nr:hypothetical protein [Cyanobacteria bacterium HKST-UBA02]